MAVRSMIISLAALCAGPALAQDTGSAAPGAKPSVESYLCTFAGKCGNAESDGVSRDAPETKGFRLARPVADTATGDKMSRATSGRRGTGQPAASMVRARARGTATPGYGSGSRQAVASSVGYPASGIGRPRADLMIGFELNSAQLTGDGVAAAQIFAKSLLRPELQSKRFLIEGHTDLRGGRGVNLPLSRARAKAVADYLVVLGVKPDRLQTRGFGADAPLPGHRATDPTNRRVEAELIS